MTRIPSRPLAMKPAPGKARCSDLSVGGLASVEQMGGASSGAGPAAANAGQTRRDGGRDRTSLRMDRRRLSLAGGPFSHRGGVSDSAITERERAAEGKSAARCLERPEAATGASRGVNREGA